MECPRKAESPMMRDIESAWRPDGTCSYCGSISPDALFACIEAGAEITPTDKNYKVYVDRPNPEAGKPCIKGWANFPQTGEGWVQITPESRQTLPLNDRQRADYQDGRWVHVTTEGPTDHAKFYFQHLSDDEMRRFVELHNTKKLKLAFPGHFYVWPFFMRPANIKAA